MAAITVNGVRLSYDEGGAGPPAIWVHGSWTDRQARAWLRRCWPSAAG